jgi:hypothetical protein
MNPSYRELYFGMSDSLNEVNERPDEFLKSYVDLNGTVNTVLSGENFLSSDLKALGKQLWHGIFEKLKRTAHI